MPAFLRCAVALGVLMIMTQTGALRDPPWKGILKKPLVITTTRGGGGSVRARRVGRTAPAAPAAAAAVWRPSFIWAIAHNWLYFLSLGLCIPVLPRVIAMAVNEDGSPTVSALSSRIGGDVEGLDKLLTFLFVGALGAASDVVGRKPLIALSAAGYAVTIALQLSTTRASGVGRLFVADAVDGMTSCMSAVCSAYVADALAASSPSEQAMAVGVFQGLSVGGAFIVGFPLSAALSTRGRYRRPMVLAAALSAANAAAALFVTPESLPLAERRRTAVAASEVNPISALARLLDRGPFLRGLTLAFACVWLANLSLNTTFVNYVNRVFHWGPQQSGSLLVVIGLMLALTPRLVVPRIGTHNAIRSGSILYAASFVAVALANTPTAFVAAIVAVGLGSVAQPALISVVARQARPEERGALLGALQTVQELAAAFAFPLYGRLFALALDKPNLSPAAPFFAAAALGALGALVADRTLPRNGASSGSHSEAQPSKKGPR